MTLSQLSRIKRWLLLHGRQRGAELQVWDLVLCYWVLGWAALPGLLVLQAWPVLPLLLLAVLSPTLYVAWRKRMHRIGRLRCDWLCAL